MTNNERCINCSHERMFHVESGWKLDYTNNMSKCYKVVTDNQRFNQPYVCPCVLYKPEKIEQ